MDLSQYRLEMLHQDGEFILYRGLRQTLTETSPPSILVLSPLMEHPTPSTLKKIAHEFSLKDELDPAWAVRPITLAQQLSRIMLLFEDPNGEALDRLLGRPMELKQFLRCGIALAAALDQVHRRGLIHKDIRPFNVLVNAAMDRAWLMGFGIASRLPRERQRAEPPEFISGTLAYMAPEQTGRMNRSVDSRSDLYGLGITLYELLSGSLPFSASDPMEWVHCHIAKQPLSPAERVRDVPRSVAGIIMKLLAKTPEERYQTAAGVEKDLRRCLKDWDRERGLQDFVLREHDTPDRLQIPEKLYGREREIETLLASFDRIINGGPPELALVSGYSGIGKSSVVNELHKVLVPPRGLFASGKFDQYKRDIPYWTLAQALQSLIRRLLSKSEVDLAPWREALREALDPSGRLMIDLVPELKLIIGAQPPVPELPPQDAQKRFQLLFRRFIGVFARPEHPLALFLDDLQWLDSATLEVLEDLLTQTQVRHLLIIGAYRDNEVDSAHPFARKIAGVREAGVNINEIKLPPLSQRDVAQLITDALQCEPERVHPFAQLVYEKTAGNPFFTVQFIDALEQESLLAFDHERGRWSWDLDRIRAKGYTDNVADLMVGKLKRLPVETQKALQQLACTGNAASVTMLSLAYETDEAQVHSNLFEAVDAELVERQDDSYKFIHDRVREAAYSLIPEAQRAEAHLRIGRLLVRHTPPEKQEEAIFEIVNQLDRGAALITSQHEKEQLAELNLIAGKRAKASTAYVSALRYLVAGAALLAEDCWDRRHELAFALELNRGECEYVTGQLEAAEERLNGLATRAATVVERAAVAGLRMDLFQRLDGVSRAIAVGIDYLLSIGVEWSPHPSEEEVGREYERIWSQLGTRAIEDLINLPVLSDPASLATLDILTKLAHIAYATDYNLQALATCHAVNLSLEHGNCAASCYAYVSLGATAGARFGNYKAAYRFGQIGYELVEQRGWKHLQPRIHLEFGALVVPWAKAVKAGRDLLRRAIEGATDIGDVIYAVGGGTHLITNMLAAGDHLSDVERVAQRSLQLALEARFGLAIEATGAQLGFVRTLRGLTRRFGCFDDEQFEEAAAERRFDSNPNLQAAEFCYWVRKVQARFFAGDYTAAIEASSRAQRLLWTSASALVFDVAEYHFYSALSHAAYCDSASRDERQQHMETVALHQRQLDTWAQNCPENFANRAALVAAEIARIESRELDAERLYEEAIKSARENGFVHNEALANELAARFYAARSFETIAHAYLRNARYCYLGWGAEGKVGELDQRHPRLRHEEAITPTGTITAPVEQLDLATVIKVSETVSSEMDLQKLLDTLMRAAIEHAGAERAVLILSRESELRIAAEGKTNIDSVTVQLHNELVTASMLPETVLHFALRTQESVILDDTKIPNPFSTDPYFAQCRARSVLCLPLTSQAKLLGTLYLENNLAPRVFAPARTAILKLLAWQAASSLENSRLYRDLVERETRIRRLVDANIIGIYIIDFGGQIVEANDAFLRMLGYEREDLASGRLRWTDLTPPEWRAADAQRLEKVKKIGSLQPFEKEYFRKDGTRVPVLVGVARFVETGNQAVVFAIDLTDRKRAEDALRASERELSAIINTVPTLAWSAGPDGIGIFFNQRWHDYTGLTPEEARGWAIAIHPDDRDRLFAHWQSAITTGQPVEIDGRLQRFDGQYRWFLFRANPLRDESGNIVKWYGTNTDIDDLKRAEAELHEAQRLTHTGSWKLDVASGRVTVSPEIFRIFDAKPGEDVSNPEFWFDRIHPEDRPRVREHFETCVAEKLEYEAAYRILLPDATVRYQHAVGRPILSPDGTLLEFLGTAMDVTEQVDARHKLESAFEEIKQLKDRLQDENVVLREQVDRAFMFEEIVGASAALKTVLSRVSKVAATDSTVLLTGETGTGKELIARAIHKRSQRSSRAFVTVNCAAIPASLIASELFGHEKGAFTGALTRRLGRFEVAEEGTIFLDEIGELPTETQITLLRVLQEREFERVGGAQTLRANVRVIAATNRDLEAAIDAGTFRSDLFYRLNVFPIEIPPLRERKEDIPLLVEYFVSRFARKAAKNIKGINKKTLDLLMSYPWPGNIRELQNVVERSVIVCETENLSVDQSWLSRKPVETPKSRLELSQLAAQEKAIIEAALRETGGRVSGPSGAAAKLRIPGSTLESKIRSLKINKNRFKPTKF